jgi:hypothetical protein
MYNSFKLVDGYALNNPDGYSETTVWTDVRNYYAYSVSVVFTGGSPEGTLVLQQSNDRQFTGGNRVEPLIAVPADNSSGTTRQVSDAVQVPPGSGATSINVNGAGVYVFNQSDIAYGWFRVVFTSVVNINTQMDVFVTIKSRS